MTDHYEQSAEDRAYRIRFKILASTVSLAFLPFALRNYLMGRPVTTALYTSACAIMFALFWAGLKARDLRQTRIVAHLIVAIATLVSVLGALWTGQGQAVGIWGLVLSPLYATYLLGARWGPIWAGFSVLAIIAIHASTTLYPIQPEFVAHGWQVAMSQIVITLMILIFGLGLRRGMDQKVDLLAAQAKVLEKARDEALAADALKTQFVATMSHEIRTPLQGVTGMAELLARTRLDAEQREMVDALIKSGKLLKSVLDDVLDFSRLESEHGVVLERAPFSPETAAEECLELFAAPAYNKGLELALVVHPGLSESYLGDPFRFRQITCNLLSNAVKFTGRGSVVVELSPLPLGFRMDVKDTGAGIPPSRQAELFQPFHQLDASTTRRFGGSGLGLAICSRLARLMEGQLKVESQEGQGSTFSLMLPLPATSPPPPAPDPDSPAMLLLGLGPETRRGLESAVQRAGFRLTGPDQVNLGSDLLLLGPQATPPENVALWLDLHPMGEPTRNGAAGSLILPAHRAALRDAVERLSHSPEGPDPGLKVAARATALIIEDTPINYKVLSCMLRELGHPSVWSEDGPQGLSLLNDQPFELVFLDLNLPTLDGLQVARSIRQLPPERQPYLVAFTASVGQRGALVEAGVDDVLTKPIDFEALRQVLDAWHERALTR